MFPIFKLMEAIDRLRRSSDLLEKVIILNKVPIYLQIFQ